jgi:hypothetical protein
VLGAELTLAETTVAEHSLDSLLAVGVLAADLLGSHCEVLSSLGFILENGCVVNGWQDVEMFVNRPGESPSAVFC